MDGKRSCVVAILCVKYIWVCVIDAEIKLSEGVLEAVMPFLLGLFEIVNGLE